MRKRAFVKVLFSLNGVPTLRNRNEAVRLQLRESSGTSRRDGIPVLAKLSGRACCFPRYPLEGSTLCHCRTLGNVSLLGLQSDSSGEEFPHWGNGRICLWLGYCGQEDERGRLRLVIFCRKFGGDSVKRVLTYRSTSTIVV